MTPSIAVPKKTYKPSKKPQRDFTKPVREIIQQRDDSLCVRCRSPYDEIHHILYKSQGGLGTVDNGVCVCRECHELAHSKKFVRKWFEKYRNERLIAK